MYSTGKMYALYLCREGQSGPINRYPEATSPSQVAGCRNGSSGGVKKQKRDGTAFTTGQLMELEKEFAMTPYLGRARRLKHADILRRNERTMPVLCRRHQIQI